MKGPSTAVVAGFAAHRGGGRVNGDVTRCGVSWLELMPVVNPELT